MSDYTYQLVVQTGPQTGTVYNLTQDIIILGRDPVADIVVNDPEVSRHHARMTRSGAEYMIQDLGSTNGTFLDGKRLSGEPQPVSAGQMVAVGSNITLLFMSVAADAASGTVLALPELDRPADLLPDLPEGEPIPDPLGTVAFNESAVAFSESAIEEEQPEIAPKPPIDDAVQEILESIALPGFRFDEEKVEPKPVTLAASEPLLLPDLGGKMPAAAPLPKSDYDSLRHTSAPYQPAPPKTEDKKRRTLTIIIAIVAILLCCCCGFMLIMYYWLGDIMLEWANTAAILSPWLLS